MHTGLDYSFRDPFNEYNEQLHSIGEAGEEKSEALTKLCNKILSSDSNEDNIHALSLMKRRLLHTEKFLSHDLEGDEFFEKTRTLFSSIISGIENDIVAQFHQIPDQEKLDTFLRLRDFEMAEILKNSEERKKIESLIASFDQASIVDEKRGETLFLKLLNFSAPPVRELAGVCLESGTDVRMENSQGRNALFYAAKQGDPDLFDNLLKQGLELEHTDSEGNYFFQNAESPDIFTIAINDPAFLLQEDAEGKAVWLRLAERASSLGWKPKKEVIPQLRKFVSSLDPAIMEEKGGLWLEQLSETMNQKESFDVECELELYQSLVVKGVVPKLENAEQQRALETVLAEAYESRSDFLLALSNGGAIPLFPFESGGRVVSLLTYLCEQFPETASVVKEHYSDGIRQSFDDYVSLRSGFSRMAFPKQIEEMQRLDRMAGVLKDAAFPHISSLHNPFIHDLENRSLHFEQLIETGHRDHDAFISAFGKLSAKDKAALKELIHARRDVELYGALEILPMKKGGRRRLFANIFLEKVIFPNKSSYNSNTAEWTTFALARAVERALDRAGPVPGETVSPEAEELVLNYLKGTFLPLVRNCGFLVRERLSGSEFTEKFGERPYQEKLVDLVSGLEPGQSTLIPWGMYMHWTGLLVEKNDEGTANVTIYNTGKGIREHHYRLDETHRFQTFLTVEKVPMESLKQAEKWKKFIDLKTCSESEKVYTFFLEQLCEGGKILPPSEFSEDYESSQVTGSCAYQFMLAMLRHQLLNLKGAGTKKERLALYKLLKAQVFHVYATDELKDLDKNIKDAAGTKMEKLSADILLAEFCADNDRCEQACLDIKAYLEKIGLEETGKALDEVPDRLLGRYALLREVSNQIVEKWLAEPELLKEMSPNLEEHLQFTLAKYQHQKGKLDERLAIIEQLYASGDPKMGFEMLMLILNTPFSANGIKWIRDHFSEDGVKEFGAGLKREDYTKEMQGLGDIIFQLTMQEEGDHYLSRLKEEYSDAPKVLAFIEYVAGKAGEQAEKKRSLDL